jgi:hypothetical protein
MPSSRPEFFVKIGSSYAALAALLLLWSGCAPEIGDECSNALDCSASGTRLCDLTQRGGYCTLEGCEKDTCPPESICVEFGRLLDDVPVARLSRSFCMYKCDNSSDCRNGDGYACFNDKNFGATREARVLGDRSQKFCAQMPPHLPAEEPPSDAGMMMSMPDDDAGAPMSMPDDDAGAPMSMPDAGTGN